MSENPFRELPDANPYKSPSTSAESQPFSTGARRLNPLVLPAIVLVVLAVLFLPVLLVSSAIQISAASQIDTSTPEGAGQFGGVIIVVIIWPMMILAIIAGSVCMMRLKGYFFAVTAALVAMLPLCSPFFLLGMPFGLWAFILLLRTDVRQRFG